MAWHVSIKPNETVKTRGGVEITNSSNFLIKIKINEPKQTQNENEIQKETENDSKESK